LLNWLLAYSVNYSALIPVSAHSMHNNGHAGSCCGNNDRHAGVADRKPHRSEKAPGARVLQASANTYSN
jgi:hypothetical protein